MPEMKTWTANGTTFTLPFAPDGFGLGGYGKNLTAADNLNNVVHNGWYSWQGSYPANAPVDAWSNMLVMGQDNHTFQLVYSIGTDAIKYRYGISGTWYQWNDMTPRSFAPAGYGLGGNPAEHIISSTAALNALYANCFFVFAGGTGDPVPSSGHTINYGYGHMEVYSDARAKQTLIPISPNHASTLVRYMRGGVWDEWEWENPPMLYDYEYRTTKRHNGKAVWVKRANIGYLFTKNVDAFLVNGCTEIVGVHLDKMYAGVTITPHVENPYCWLQIIVDSDHDWSSRTVVLTLEYTKD